NSWGTDWGGTCGYGSEGGYFTIAYGSASIGKWSSFMYDWQDYDSSGGIMYYDEGGWSTSTGYGDTTAWGLAKFFPSSNTYVTRAEFWTTDVTTDVDVYIYDDFNGTTPSNLLAQSLNHSFNEAGYHSVALASPLAVTAGDDVIAVVKFTNDSDTHPVPLDPDGPKETQRTYYSSSGASGSWTESVYDVAIRLRTSTALGPDVSITKQVIGSDFAPGDPIVFTLAIANSGAEAASQVVVTDIVPTEVVTPTFASTLAITQTGISSYVWNVEPLGIGQGGVISIYGWIDPGLGSDFSFANTATISDPEDNTPNNNTSSVTVGERKVYLPLMLKGYPPPPPGTFSSAGDACVMEGRATTNFGSTSDMWAGYDDYLSPDGKIVRSLIQFDVSAIPSGTSIDSAVLRVYLVESWDYPGRTRTVTAYRIGSSWSESSVTWNTRPSCAEAYGSDSVTHGSWGWYSFDVTNLVSGWVDGSLSNYGVMLRGPEVSGYDSSWRSFSTREGSYTPQLAVTYSGYTTPSDARLAEESLSGEEPAHVIIEALTGRQNADSPGIGLCQPHSPAGEKCLALP
ncbi:MAG: DNRLRE domain-containing protein, partial [Anaerolineae bacterium]|nr:DNRLRE domain-containing protein [Anaerolineae bacterium]